MRRGRLVVIALVLLSAAGCELIVGPDAGDRLAFITGFEDADPQVTVPATVMAGEPFTVRVRTYGPSGCWTRGHTEVAPWAGSAVLSPFDHHNGGEVCTGILQLFEHAAEVTFHATGAARVVVRGREGGSLQMVTYSYPVEVVE